MNGDGKQRSAGRRLARFIVWTTFALAVFVRFVLFHDGRRFEPPPNRPFWQPPRPFSQVVQPPVSEVPKDLPRIQIQIAPNDVNTLRGYFWNGWQGRPQDRPEVLATVREGDVVYTNVALHLKGAAGSFRPFDDKPALTLNFSKHAHGQRFHQHSKLSLNNSVQDPTLLTEAICRELYNAAGVPAPKAEWATVIMNGRDLGLYVMVEGWNKDFLRRYFKNVSGNLYDGGFCQDVNQNLSVNSGDHPDDRSDLDRLVAATRGEATNRWTRLSQVLDVDRFVTLAVIEVMTCNWDGYCLNKNNYRVYHDLDTDRMVFMPHGLDQMFGWPAHRFDAEASVQPGMRGIVARAVLGTPEGSTLYQERLDVIRTNLFQEERLISRVQELDRHIRPTIAAYSPAMAQRHDADVAFLCDRIRRRIQNVARQRDHPTIPVPFDASGSAQLMECSDPFKMPGRMLKLDHIRRGDENLLHIVAGGQRDSGSWRMRVLLPKGQYRFEGRARMSPNATDGRVTLRISGDSAARGQGSTGAEWIPLSYSFPVNPLNAAPAEVVLVCEFSGAKGEAWFDLNSLRLIRE
jgi:hypothetical protein